MITKQDAAVPGSKELFNFSHIICENIVNWLDGHGMPENKGVFLYNDYTDTAVNRSGGYPIAEHIDFAVKYSVSQEKCQMDLHGFAFCDVLKEFLRNLWRNFLEDAPFTTEFAGSNLRINVELQAAQKCPGCDPDDKTILI